MAGTKGNIKTQTLTISIDIKSNWYLQSMDHQGRASPNHSHVMMETFSLINFTLMDPLLTQMTKIAWHPTISCILSIIFCSMDINSHLCKFLHQQASVRTQVSVVLTSFCSAIPV